MNDQEPPDTRSLRIFLATAEERSMSKAGQKMGITQSAVSQSIRSLEDYFGASLFNRTTRPLTLTPAGLALKNRAAVQIREFMNLRASVLEARDGVRPDLRIGLVDSFAAICGVYLVRELMSRTGRLAIRSGPAPTLSEAFTRRDLDITISSDPMSDISGISSTRVIQEQFLIITPKSLPSKPRTIEDLRRLAASLPMLNFNLHSNARVTIDRLLRRHEIRSSTRLEVDTAYTLTAMVAGGIGWAMTTPLLLLHGSQFARSVEPTVIQGLTGSRSTYVVARQDELPYVPNQLHATTLSIMKNHVLPDLRELDISLEKLVQLTPM